MDYPGNNKFWVTKVEVFITCEELVSVWNVSKYGVFLVRIFPHSDWIRTRKNCVFGHFSCNECNEWNWLGKQTRRRTVKYLDWKKKWEKHFSRTKKDRKWYLTQKNWVNILVGLKRDGADLSWGKIRRSIKATSYKYQLIQFDVVELLFNFFYQFINKFLQSWSKYLRQTLVLVWNSGLREKFNFNF